MKVLFALEDYIIDPLGIAYLSSYLKQFGHEINLVNFDAEDLFAKIKSYSPHVIAYSITTGRHSKFRRINAEVKNSATAPFSLFGGPHTTFYPQFVEEEGVDAICVGEGFVGFAELLSRLYHNKPLDDIPNIRTKGQTWGEMAPLMDMDSVPFPDRELIYKYRKNQENPIRSIIASFQCALGCKYCVDEDTLIFMADGTTREIKHLREGDVIVGVEKRETKEWYCVPAIVQNIWETEREAYRITLADGTEVVCSGDHRWLSDRGGATEWKHTTYIHRKPYLTTKNRIRGFGHIPKTPPITEDYMRGYLSGMIRGDASMGIYDYQNPRGGDRQHHFRLALKDVEGIERTKKYLAHFDVEVNEFVFQGDMCGIRTQQRGNYYAILDLIRYQCDSSEFIRGFLAGIFDAEGSGGSPKRCIRISNSNEKILDTIKQGLRLFGFDYVTETSLDKINHQVHTIRIRGGANAYYRFFAITDPAIKRKVRIEGLAIKNSQQIVSIEPLGEKRRMFDITTSTENFIANGLISHNCYAPKYREIYNLKGFGTINARAPHLVAKEAEEVRSQYRTELFYFQDDVFPVWSKGWVDAFCEHWDSGAFHIQIRAEMINDALIKKLKGAGLHGVTFAVESGVDRIRREILNRKMSNEQIIEAAEILHANDIRFRVENMMGTLDETFADTLETLKLNIKCKPTLAWASLWQPYPGTALGDEAIERGLFNPESDEIGFDFFHDTILTGKESRYISNLQKLFGVTVKYPILRHITPLLCRLPCNPLFDWIYRKFKQWMYESRLYNVKPHLRGSKQMDE